MSESTARPVRPAERLETSGAGRVGVVVIGRNEGERLRSSLCAAGASGAPVVYADSGSSDASLDVARAQGVVAFPVEGRPLTAARGRNEGLAKLRELYADVEYVQFVDGDTVLDPAWIGHARQALLAEPRVAAVCGHLDERDARSSTVRNLLQLEWRGPVGDIEACAGNAVYRTEALERVGGFRDSIVGGEEPELCARLRDAGWRIARIDFPMGVHDSSIDTLAAWWTRAVRVGSAFAALARDPGSHRHARAAGVVKSALIWGLLLPSCLVAGLAASAFETRMLVVPATIGLLYAAQTARIAVRSALRGMSFGDAILYATFCMLGKAAQVQGWFVHRRRISSPPPAQRNGVAGPVS